MVQKQGRLVVPDHEKWIDEIERGDILLEHGKTPRVVRSVTKINGQTYYVYFAIKRCSWTRRCYTTVNRTDLRNRGFKPSGARQTKMDLVDKRIAFSIEHKDFDRQKAFCWDVIGVKT